jgi:uncharacterized protein (TIGR03382 family)
MEEIMLKNTCNVLTALLILLCFSAAQADDKAVIRNKALLAMKAAEKGYVRVIIELNVDNYKTLASSSAFAGEADGKEERKKTAEKADSALTSAVREAGSRVASKHEGNGFFLRRQFKYIPAIAAEISAEMIEELANDPDIASVEEDVPMALPSTQAVNDPVDGTGIIGAEAAWLAGYSGSGWYVAILDNGIRSTHEFFSGKNIVEACFSDGDCPNGQDAMYGSGSAVHYSSDYGEDYDHGTHVTGIAAGRKPDGTLYGAAKDAGIISVQIFSKFDNNPEDCGYPDGKCLLSYSSDQFSALEYIYSLRTTYNIGAVNMSIGGSTYSNYCDSQSSLNSIITNLTNAGIAVVSASGNEELCGMITSPACISETIAVSASNGLDRQASFSNYLASVVDIFAPGVNIKSSIASSDTAYEAWSGTSMSTPFVAGSWVLFKQKNSSLSVSQIETYMKNTAAPVNITCSPAGDEGRLNTAAAISAIPSPVQDGAPYGLVISLNEGNAYTNSTETTAALAGVDDDFISGYYISENSAEPALNDFTTVAFTDTFSTETVFHLSEGEGTKTVYFWLKDNGGNISDPSSDSIVLDITPPRVLSISPEGGETGVSVRPVITAAFSEMPNPDTLTDEAAALTPSAGGEAVPISIVDSDVNAHSISVTPDTDLEYLTAYTITIGTEIEDYAGNSLQSSFSSSFTTVGEQTDEPDNDTDTDEPSGGGGGGGCSAGGTEGGLALLMAGASLILLRRKLI